MQVPLQSLGRGVASPGNDSSHPKGGFEDVWAKLETALLFCWQQRAPGRETLERCWACGWLKWHQTNPTRRFHVEMNILKPHPCPELCESAGSQSCSFWDKISATLLILYQSQCLKSLEEFSFLLRPSSAEGSCVFSPTHALVFCSSPREAPTVSNRWQIWQTIFNAA